MIRLFLCLLFLAPIVARADDAPPPPTVFIDGAWQVGDCLQQNTARGHLTTTGTPCGAGGGPTGAAGGVLSGTYPNPAIAAAANLGTPGTLVLTNATGLPIAGLTGLGTGVGTALGVNIGSAGAPILFNGVGGTPSSLTLTNATGLPIAGITGLGTGVGTALAQAATGSGGIVLATSPTIATGMTLGFLTGSTQCLHVNTSGVVSGTGADCGSGGGGSWNLTDGTTSLTGVTALTVPGGTLKVGGTAGAATLTPIVTEASHATNFSSWNVGGQDDASASLTATLPTFTAGQSALLTAQSGATVTVGLNSQTVNGLGLNTTLHQFGFYGYTYSSAGVASAFGFPGYGTITTNAIGKFLDGSGAMTASGLTDNGTTISTGSETLTLGTVTGSTQCVHANSSGVLSGTGSDCGVGSSGITFTDGTHTVTGSTQLTVTGGTVGGTTPNATLTISGGGITCPTGFSVSGASCVWTQTSSGSVAELDWTGLTGDNYHLMCSGLASTAGNPATGIQFGEGGTPTWQTGSNYPWGQLYQQVTGSPAASGNGGTATHAMEVLTATGASPASSYNIWFFGLARTGIQKAWSGTTLMVQSSTYVQTQAGYFNGDTNAITALRLIIASGNLASTTKCTLYAEGS